VLVDRLNHGTILTEPTDLLQDLVRGALGVETGEEFEAWNDDALRKTASVREKAGRWQQFVIRVVDERHDPVPDWNLELYGRQNARRPLRSFSMDVHVYDLDPSLRCFHVNLDELEPEQLSQLHLNVIASSGSRLVGYHGLGARAGTDGEGVQGTWEGRINLTAALGKDGQFRLFYPYTTTFVEILLNREPMPPGGSNRVFWFPGTRT
jgi:hypothetical protein